jgi:hypothetical protein
MLALALSIAALVYALGFVFFGVVAFVLTCGFPSASRGGSSDGLKLFLFVVFWPLAIGYGLVRSLFD